MCAISCTARSNASWFAFDGFVVPAILRTYCSAAAWTSSERGGGLEVVEGVDVPAHAPDDTPPLPPCARLHLRTFPGPGKVRN